MREKRESHYETWSYAGKKTFYCKTELIFQTRVFPIIEMKLLSRNQNIDCQLNFNWEN